MDTTSDPYDYSTARLLRAKTTECAELRDLLTAVAQDLERLASEHPEHAERFRARAMRPRRRLWEAIGRG
jgi:hypothetical protein